MRGTARVGHVLEGGVPAGVARDEGAQERRRCRESTRTRSRGVCLGYHAVDVAGEPKRPIFSLFFCRYRYQNPIEHVSTIS